MIYDDLDASSLLKLGYSVLWNVVLVEVELDGWTPLLSLPTYDVFRAIKAIRSHPECVML